LQIGKRLRMPGHQLRTGSIEDEMVGHLGSPARAWTGTLLTSSHRRLYMALNNFHHYQANLTTSHHISSHLISSHLISAPIYHKHHGRSLEGSQWRPLHPKLQTAIYVKHPSPTNREVRYPTPRHIHGLK
jgi:hypothetical protein